MEQHGNKLDDNNSEEEEHENDSNGLQVKVFLGDKNLTK